MTSPVEHDPDPGAHRLLRKFRSADSYGLLVVMIAVTYVLAVWLDHSWGATVVLFIQIATVRLALRTSMARRPLRLTADALFVVSGIGAVANLFIGTRDDLLPFVFFASGAVLYFIAPFSILRHIVFRREVDGETMLGALAAYLLFGMAFAFSYRFIGEVQSEPFFGVDGKGTVAQDLFFSFVTLTTTGYGNLVPEDNPGQTIAVLEALLGQLFLVTAVAKFVNIWKPKAWTGGGRRRRRSHRRIRPGHDGALGATTGGTNMSTHLGDDHDGHHHDDGHHHEHDRATASVPMRWSRSARPGWRRSTAASSPTSSPTARGGSTTPGSSSAPTASWRSTPASPSAARGRSSRRVGRSRRNRCGRSSTRTTTVTTRTATSCLPRDDRRPRAAATRR